MHHIFNIIALVVEIYVGILIVRALLSWVPAQPGTGLASFNSVLAAITEPVIRPVRRVIPTLRMGGSGIDVSFMVVVIGLEIVVYILHRI